MTCAMVCLEFPWYDPPADRKLGWQACLEDATVNHFQENMTLTVAIASQRSCRGEDKHISLQGPSLNLPRCFQWDVFLAPRSFNWRKPIKDWRLIPWAEPVGKGRHQESPSRWCLDRSLPEPLQFVLKLQGYSLEIGRPRLKHGSWEWNFLVLY